MSSTVLPYRPAHARQEDTARVGMLIFLGSWAMMFAALFFALGVVRWRSPQWPPEGVGPLPVALAVVNTTVLALSSVALEAALRSVRSGRLLHMRRWLWIAVGLGSAFLGLQIVLWTKVAQAGVRWEAGAFGGAVFGLCGFHALHVLVGVGGLLTAAMAWRALQPARHLRLRLWAHYWHFVGVVWLVLFSAIFAGATGG
jgi:cytochrome c oxidase subunit 3